MVCGWHRRPSCPVAKAWGRSPKRGAEDGGESSAVPLAPDMPRPEACPFTLETALSRRTCSNPSLRKKHHPANVLRKWSHLNSVSSLSGAEAERWAQWSRRTPRIDGQYRRESPGSFDCVPSRLRPPTKLRSKVDCACFAEPERSGGVAKQALAFGAGGRSGSLKKTISSSTGDTRRVGVES